MTKLKPWIIYYSLIGEVGSMNIEEVGDWLMRGLTFKVRDSTGYWEQAHRCLDLSRVGCGKDLSGFPALSIGNNSLHLNSYRNSTATHPSSIVRLPISAKIYHGMYYQNFGQLGSELDEDPGRVTTISVIIIILHALFNTLCQGSLRKHKAEIWNIKSNF